jgi:hypothetical protein
VTAFVSFITLILIPIPMVRELAITASLGVGFKIITNLVMLPITASMFNFTKQYADEAMLKREQRAGWLRVIARVAEPRNALVVIGITTVIFGVAVWQSHDRVIGTLQPGAPELRADAPFQPRRRGDCRKLRCGPRLADRDLRGRPPTLARTSPSGSTRTSFTWTMQNVPRGALGEFLCGAVAGVQ